MEGLTPHHYFERLQSCFRDLGMESPLELPRGSNCFRFLAAADSMVYCKDQTSVLVVAALLVLEHILKVHLRLMVVQICRFQNKAPSCLNLCLPFINETGIFIF